MSELVAASQAPQESIIASQTTAVTSQISAVGQLKSALSTFQSALTSLATPSAFQSLTASSSDSTVFSASAASGAVPGTYSVTVSNLASGQQLLSNAFAGGSNAVVGDGTLTLSLGGSSFDVSIDASNDSVAGIAAAINSASGNPGITAAVVNGTDGAHLVLSSSVTGAANTIQVAQTDGGSGLSTLSYSSGSTGNYQQESKAADAAFSVAGVNYTSASNTISDALSGVTLNLTGPTASGASATLTVADDNSTVQSDIQAFVSAYNALQASLASLGSYDASTSTAGPMQGNPLLQNIQSQISHTLYSLVGSSTYNSLASVGITANSDGSLSVNPTSLSNALSTNFSAVSQLFSGSNGIAAQLNSQISADLASGGSIATRQQTLTTQENNLTKQSDNLATQMQALTASLTQQYSALNALLSSLQTTSSYLTQAFNALPSVQGKPNA
ncbi:MAG TPA: flagellar filament capping protein FliD [Steroidobacteraceae bacterium]